MGIFSPETLKIPIILMGFSPDGHIDTPVSRGKTLPISEISSEVFHVSK